MSSLVKQPDEINMYFPFKHWIRILPLAFSFSLESDMYLTQTNKA